MNFTFFFKQTSSMCIFFLVCFIFYGCSSNIKEDSDDRKQIANLLDSFNEAAAKADFNTYFGYYAEDAVFIGTDATERWEKESFMAWSKPYFDKGKSWSFKTIERHIYLDKTGTFAWFDELLSTRMKICRGSGVLIKQNGEWKIEQYVLSMTVPNEQADTIIKIKSAIEEEIISKLSQK